MTELTWLAIAICITQSGTLSGLNLALFSLPRFQLEVKSREGHAGATRVLALRRDPNLLLTTIIWANVAANCLLTLLSGSVLAGVAAFAFSTVAITMLGEILPQALFLKYALRIGPALIPLIRLYQVVLYPVAKPCALLLDRWLGSEERVWVRHGDASEALRILMETEESGIGRFEGRGALNFLELGDRPIRDEGAPLTPASVVELESVADELVFPDSAEPLSRQQFQQKVHAPRSPWVVLTDRSGRPLAVLNADAFLRASLTEADVNPRDFCHKPVVVTDPSVSLQNALTMALTAAPSGREPAVILLWGSDKRIVARTHILESLLRHI